MKFVNFRMESVHSAKHNLVDARVLSFKEDWGSSYQNTAVIYWTKGSARRRKKKLLARLMSSSREAVP
jgi:hypothetical protein